MVDHRFRELEEKLKYRFRDQRLLSQALTHSSATADALADNERMEFLGDAILALVVSEELFRVQAACDEGELTRFKSNAVSTSSLARCGRRLALERYAILGKGIDPANLPPSVYANLVEALLAAVYLDAELETARKVVLGLLADEIEAAVSGERDKNYKSILQEHVQRELGQAPQYRVVRESGPDHGKTFIISAVIDGVSYPPAEGQSKKQAEQRAAACALESLGVEL